MIDYCTLSDKDLSWEVSKVLYGNEIERFCLSDCESFVYDCGPIGDQFHRVDIVDYCNSPEEAWPLIEKSWLTLNTIAKFDDGIGFGERDMTIWQVHTHMAGGNKLRAAVIVFLLESAK